MHSLILSLFVSVILATNNSRGELPIGLTEDERNILFHELEATQTPLEREYTRDKRLYIDPYNSIATNVVRYITGDITKETFLAAGYSDEVNMYITGTGDTESLRNSIMTGGKNGTALFTKEDYYDYRREPDPDAYENPQNPHDTNTKEHIEFNDDVQNYHIIKMIENLLVGEARRLERSINKELDKSLFKWGKTDTAVNAEWQKNLMLLRSQEAGTIENRLAVDTDLMNRLEEEYISSDPDSQYSKMPNAPDNSSAVPAGVR